MVDLQLATCIDELMDLYTGLHCPTMMLLSEVARRTLDGSPELLSQEEIRNFIINKMGEWNGRWQPEGLFRLFSNFLTRIFPD